MMTELFGELNSLLRKGNYFVSARRNLTQVDALSANPGFHAINIHVSTRIDAWMNNMTDNGYLLVEHRLVGEGLPYEE